MSVRAVEWIGGLDGVLRLIDQTRLPAELVFLECREPEAVFEAIRMLRVRGAPAIGVAAAMGAVLGIRNASDDASEALIERLKEVSDYLSRSRPTAVNLFWALERMRTAMDRVRSDPVGELLAEAHAIHAEDVAANRRMGELGADYLDGATAILTHCNTGSLATGGYGTALGVIRSTFRRGAKRIFATETRPWLQGARLTVWELDQDRIPATLIADSAAAFLMKSGQVQWVIVGADRIAANGDTANKIGTYALAVAARHHGVKFMVVAPTSTIDWQTTHGESIEIEERDRRELLSGHFMRPESVIDAWNPVFDVTPVDLIDVIVTEQGAIEKPGIQPMQLLAR